MAAFNIGTIVSTSVHEAYPGHYVQFLWVPQAPKQGPQAAWSVEATPRAGRTIANR